MSEGNDESYETRRAREERAADEAYERLQKDGPDRSTDPKSPNFDAQLATEREAMIDKSGLDPEDDDAEDDADVEDDADDNAEDDDEYDHDYARNGEIPSDIPGNRTDRYEDRTD